MTAPSWLSTIADYVELDLFEPTSPPHDHETHEIVMRHAYGTKPMVTMSVRARLRLRRPAC